MPSKTKRLKKPTTSEPLAPKSGNNGGNFHLLALVFIVPVCALVLLSGILLLANSLYGQSWNATFSTTEAATTKTNPTKPQTSLTRLYVNDATQRQAVCNDGSPAAYYFAPGIEAYKDKWVIWFEGGGSCHDEQGCLDRRTEDFSLTSSKNIARSIKLGGIMSPDKTTNPDFYGWNHVKLHYCSSDTWDGDKEVQIGNNVWQFQGKDITKAIIEDLSNSAVISTATLADASEVIITGSSAGGGGAVQNLDDVAGSLPWARVTGLIDSSWGIDIEPYQPQNVDEAAVTTFQNRIYDSSCTQALGPAEAHRCGDWEVVESYLDTPTFFFINQRDHKKLEGHGVVAPYDAGETAWINDTFIPSLISSFDLIEPNDGLYSPNLTFHTMVTNDRFFRPYIDGLSPADVFANWHFGRSGPTRLIGE